MLIGELARRLRVSTRTLRHYESLGLLQPADVDRNTGYRTYGAAELIRGVQIEQLKAAGLGLEEIRRALDGDASLVAILQARRQQLRRDIDNRAVQVATIDALLRGEHAISSPEVVTLDEVNVVSTVISSPADELATAIRRQIQRLRRRVRAIGAGPWTFAARLPLDVGDALAVEVAAVSEAAAVSEVAAGDGTRWRPVRAIQVACAGPLSLLPLAYDAALAAAEAGGHRLTGTVQETYVDFGPSPRTAIAMLVER